MSSHMKIEFSVVLVSYSESPMARTRQSRKLGQGANPSDTLPSKIIPGHGPSIPQRDMHL